MKKFKFIDLFAGIGGFHQAMTSIGGQCVFASEIDEPAIDTYKENYGINSGVDITKVDPKMIPKHDVLCAGFPCQAFSKAGNQLGFQDKTKGTLFFEIVRILKYHQTPYIILENVRNLAAHDKGRTWEIIKNSLKELGYVVTEKPIIISPHHLGIPQLRERVVILGVHKSIGVDKIDITVPKVEKNSLDFLSYGILQEEPVDKKYYISEYEEKVLNCWDDFIKGIKETIIGFPIWSFEFKEIYDYTDPKYNYPEWKQIFIKKNRELYLNNKKFIDKWFKKYNNLDDFVPTHRKFEWQCGEYHSSVWDGIIQFRPSGIRVKRANVFPALVAMVHIPIIGPLKRRITPREAARLQSFPDNFIINKNDFQAYKQFGNAVNVKVIEYMAKQLFALKPNKKIDY